MSISEIRVPLKQVVVKTRNAKSGSPYFYFEVLEPKWQFLQTDNNARVEAMLKQLAQSGEPIDLNVCFKKDSFVVDEQSF